MGPSRRPEPGRPRPGPGPGPGPPPGVEAPNCAPHVHGGWAAPQPPHRAIARPGLVPAPRFGEGGRQASERQVRRRMHACQLLLGQAVGHRQHRLALKRLDGSQPPRARKPHRDRHIHGGRSRPRSRRRAHTRRTRAGLGPCRRVRRYSVQRCCGDQPGRRPSFQLLEPVPITHLCTNPSGSNTGTPGRGASCRITSRLMIGPTFRCKVIFRLARVSFSPDTTACGEPGRQPQRRTGLSQALAN